MSDDEALKVFVGVLILAALAIGGAVYSIFRRMHQNTQRALALSPCHASEKYTPSNPKEPLLYSVFSNREHVIRDHSSNRVATIEFPVAKKNLHRVIHIADASYECYREFGLAKDKVHLYDSGADPDNTEPLLTFFCGIKSEYYRRGELECYTRNFFDRHNGKGWPIYSSGRVVAYVEALYPLMKANAFLFHPIDEFPLVEQIFIIAMSDRYGA